MATNEEQFDLSIDQHQLDREWINQPRRYMGIARQLADARRRQDECKNELEVTRAELDRAIREAPSEYEITKVTESAIGAAILTQGQYQKAEKRYRDARYDVTIFESAVQAMEHRKRALENLVSLHLAGYFAAPRAPEGAREEVADMEKTLIRRRGTVSQRDVE